MLGTRREQDVVVSGDRNGGTQGGVLGDLNDPSGFAGQGPTETPVVVAVSRGNRALNPLIDRRSKG